MTTFIVNAIIIASCEKGSICSRNQGTPSSKGIFSCLFPFFFLSGMACQVSGAVVSAVSAMTVQLGRKIAPVIVEKGGKVSYLYLLFFFFHLLFSFSLFSPPSIVFQWKTSKIMCHILSQSGKSGQNQSHRFPALFAGWRVVSFRCDWLIWLKVFHQTWLTQTSFTHVFEH